MRVPAGPRGLAGFVIPAVLLAIVTAGFGWAPPETGKVAVVFNSGVEAYAEAVDGIRAGLKQTSLLGFFIDLKGGKAVADLATLPGSRVVIAVGSEALDELLSRKSDLPLVATMMLRSDLARVASTSNRSRVVDGVYLDVPLAGLLSELKLLFPGKTRLGVVNNPALYPQDEVSISTRVRQLGFTPEVINIARPEDLLGAFGSLKGKADFVLVFPDGTLYNAATVKPLILASLEKRLPIIGFSLSFVRAGAAAGIYPNFQDIGFQTVEVAHKYLAGQTVSSDGTPRKLTVAINQRVLRLLGLEHASSRDGELVTIR